MNQNPYHSPAAAGTPTRLRPTRWLVWTGFASLGLAVLCIALGIVGMVVSFQTVAMSTSTPVPQDLARGISNSLLFFIPAVLLGILGVILLVAGFVLRSLEKPTSVG